MPDTPLVRHAVIFCKVARLDALTPHLGEDTEVVAVHDPTTLEEGPHPACEVILVEDALCGLVPHALMRVIRTHWPYCPVLVLSDNPSPEAGAQWLEVGAAGYYPLADAELLPVYIRAALRQRPSELALQDALLQMETLYSLCRKLIATHDLQELLNVFMETVLRKHGGTADLFLVDDSDDKKPRWATFGARTVHSTEPPKKLHAPAIPVSVLRSLVSAPANQPPHTWIGAVGEPHASYFRQMAPQALIAIDLYGSRERLVGFVVLYLTDTQPLTAAERLVISTLKPLVGALLDSTRLLREAQRAEERFRALVEESQDAILIRELDETLHTYGVAIAEMTGYSAEALHRTNNRNLLRDLLHPADHQKVLEAVGQSEAQPGQPITVEARYHHKDGGWRWVEIVYRNMLHHPAVKGTVINARDITDRYEALEALKASEQRFRTLASSTTAAVFLIRENRFIDVNAAAERITGHPREALLGMTLTDLVHEDDVDEVARWMQQCVDEDPPGFRREAQIIDTDGYGHWVDLTCGVVTDAHTPTTLIVTAFDISERRIIEEALIKSTERFMRIAEKAPDLIFRWSSERGTYEYISPASTFVTGYKSEDYYAHPELIEKSVLDEDMPHFRRIFSEDVDPDETVTVRQRHQDGHILYMEYRVAPVFSSEGDFVAVEGIARDVTQHVLATQRLRQLTVRLTNAQEEERRRISRDLHDEIGQLLTASKMRLSLLQRAIPPQAEKAFERLEALDALVDEILHMVRTISHELRPALLDEMGWAAAIRWLCEGFGTNREMPVSFFILGADGEEIDSITQPEAVPRLDGLTEITAYRAVQEALTNVGKHADATEVTVIARVSDDMLTLSIIDDGRGMDNTPLHRAGEPSGLGLVGMSERVVAAGGSLDIVSAPGEGTEVIVTLPTHNDSEEPIS